MMPVLSLEISPSSSPASRIAWSMATWFQAVPPPWKRMARRSTSFFRVERGRAVHLAAEAELRIFFGARNAGFGFAQAGQNFLCVVADGRDDAHPGDDDPSHELPRPRLIRAAARLAPSSSARLRHRLVAKQADLEIHRPIDDRPSA